MSNPSFIEVRNVDVSYKPAGTMLTKLTGRPSIPHSVLHDVTFSLDGSDQGVLFGETGAGKSTLFRLMAGAIKPSRGTIKINGQKPQAIPHLAAGYVSPEESEPKSESVQQVLFAFTKQHDISSAPARISEVLEILSISHLASRLVNTLSSTERLRVNIARAALSKAPIILLDDVLDQLGAREVKRIISTVFSGRAVLIATRSVQDAEAMNVPIAILHKGKIVHFGHQQEIAGKATCPRTVNAWVEGLRYDLLRSIKALPGVLEVRLVPTDQFEGQRLKVVVQSSRYLPGLYDLVSQAPLIKIEEEPASLREILTSLD